MKRHLIDIYAAWIFSFSILLFGCSSEKPLKEESGNEKLLVVTTLFPYYDFARAVAGDLIELELILPPGQESHSFEPTAEDLILMGEADVLLYNGGESEQWMERVLEMNEEKEQQTQVLLAGMDIVSLYEEETTEHMAAHDHEQDETSAEEDTAISYEISYDEHIWTSPVNAIRLVEAVRDCLIEAAPQYETEFEENASAYMEKITLLDEQFREAVQNGEKDILVFADRFPFLYFVKEYGLRYDAAFPGCSSDTEPSAATIAGLIELVKEEEIPAVYHVEQSNEKTASILREATGVSVLELHSCHTLTKEQMEAGVTYVDLMEKNLEAIKQGLGSKSGGE